MMAWRPSSSLFTSISRSLNCEQLRGTNVSRKLFEPQLNANAMGEDCRCHKDRFGKRELPVGRLEGARPSYLIHLAS